MAIEDAEIKGYSPQIGASWGSTAAAQRERKSKSQWVRDTLIDAARRKASQATGKESVEFGADQGSPT